MGNRPVEAITTADLRAYLAYLRTDFRPVRFGGRADPLSPKTLHNIYITLSSFFTWLHGEFNLPNPLRPVSRPAFKEPEVVPFSQADIKALLKASEYSREARTVARSRFVMRRRNAYRDRALILTLLDTGLRASEICALNVRDVDPQDGAVEVKHGVRGGAKGAKGPGRVLRPSRV